MSGFPLKRRTLLGASVTSLFLPLSSSALAAQARPAGRTGPALGYIKLNANENPYGPCAAARRAARAAVDLGARYVPGDVEDALVRRIAEREGLSPEHVVLTAGSSELLCTVGAAFGLGDGHLVVSENVFRVLPRYAERLGGSVLHVPLAGDWTHDLEAMERRVGQGTRLVYVCNPSNPTGTVVPPARLRAFCEAVAPRAPVLIDEAYLEYLDPQEDASMVGLLRAGRDVLISRTFSKVYGLAGLRIGYGLARPEVAARLRALRMSLPSPVSVAAARASLEDPTFVATSRARNAEARAFTSQALTRLGVEHVPGHANFLWFRAPHRDLPAALFRRNVRITHTPAPLDREWTRVSMGTLHDMRAFIAALAASLHA